MPVFEMRTATITEKGQIVIPKALRKKTFKEGSKVAIIAFDDRIEVRPLKKVSSAMEMALMSEASLAKDWDAPEEDRAWKDL